jgi:chorismate dehydratase
MTNPLRLGRIDFINVIPLHRHLKPHPGFQEICAVPSALNRMVAGGELDLSGVSSVEYAHHAEDYLLLPDLGLFSRGAVASVLLLSQEPMSAWQGREIEVPFESDTSVALLRLLLRRLWNLDCTLVAEGKAAQPAAALRIGNRALAEAASGRWPQVWDMGQVWWDWTGLPFVYALWVVRWEVAERRGAEVARLHRALLAARDQGVADRQGCARQAAEFLGGELALYLDYFAGLGYGLGPEELKGLGKFFAMLAEDGWLKAAPAPRFFGA